MPEHQQAAMPSHRVSTTGPDQATEAHVVQDLFHIAAHLLGIFHSQSDPQQLPSPRHTDTAHYPLHLHQATDTHTQAVHPQTHQQHGRQGVAGQLATDTDRAVVDSRTLYNLIECTQHRGM